MKDFKNFDEMMEDQGGAKDTEVPTPWGDSDFEMVGDFIAIYAHSQSVAKAQDFAKRNNLFVVTETITDNDNDESVFSYSRGFSYVNRERFFFTRKNDDFCFDDML